MDDKMFSSEPVLDMMRFMTGIASATIAFRELVRLHAELFIDHCRACRGSGRLTCPHCAGTASVRTRPAEPSLRAMSLVTRAPTDVVVCARCGPPSPFDEDPGLAAELDEIVAKWEENQENGGGEGGEELAEVDEELDGKRYGEEIRENISAALLGKRLLPHETPFLAGTVPCDACGGEPKVSRHTPNPQVFLQLEQSFQTDASLRAGDFFWPRRAGFPRAFLGRTDEEIEEEEAEEEAEKARFYSGHGQPLVFPDRKGKAAPLPKGAAAAAAAEKLRHRRERRTYGEAPSRPRMDHFWRDMLASAKASPWNVVARVRGGAGEDGPGGWTSSDSEDEDEGEGLASSSSSAANGANDDDEEEPEEEKLDEDGNPIPKSKPKKERKKKRTLASKEEEESRAALRRERRRRKGRRAPPPLTMQELFGDELSIKFAQAFEDPETGEVKREGLEEFMAGMMDKDGAGGGGGGGEKGEEKSGGGGGGGGGGKSGGREAAADDGGRDGDEDEDDDDEDDEE